MAETRSDPKAPEIETIRAALRRVVDPEVGVNIVDLGLVYAIEIRPTGVYVALTMTSPACPLGDLIVDEVRAELGALAAARPDEAPPEIELVWNPPWDPAMMSPAARVRLGG